MSNDQNTTRRFVQANLSEFSKKASEGCSKPVKKFFKDMLFGLCATGSPSIHNIAKLLQDKTSTKKTSERLYRNLHRDGIDKLIGDVLIDMLKPRVKEDTLFIVDESDIEKPYAKKMEGCQMVHNGSKSEQTNGYLLLNIVALIAQQDGYNLLPASSILFSPKMELDSAKQVLQDQIIDQQIAFCNKGTYVFDRGYDDRKLIGFLIDNGVSFVIRGMGLRTVKEGLVEKNFKEVVDDMEFKYQLDGFKNGETFHCATRRVSVRTDDHPSKRSNSVEVSVVVVRKYKRGAKKGKDFYLFCDFDDPNMPEQEIITKAIDIYKKRWAIEEVHRQMKQSMRWESMRLGSYQGMKNLNAFMALALYFIYKCKDYVHILAIGFPKLLKYVKKDWTKPKEFIYYRITDVLNICINQIIQYKRRPSIEERRDQWQIKIRLN
ncbi:MAG: transposase [Bacteroidales bacterium]